MNSSSERLHALDAVRGFALLAGIVFHATLSFLPSPHGAVIWATEDSQRSVALAVTFFTLHVFRMTTFFMMAGYFAHLVFHKRGARAFIRDRLKRIALPLVVAWPIVFAGIVAATIWGALKMSAHGTKLPPPPAYHFPAFPWTHLWFLYVLLLLYAAVVLLRLPVAALDRGQHLRRLVDRVLQVAASNGLLFAILATPAATALYFTTPWLCWFGIPTPDSSLVPNMAATAAFSVAFGFGWLAHRVPGLLETWRKQWPLHLLVAVVFIAICLGITGLVPVIVPEARPLQKLMFAVSYALASWSLTLAIVGFALRFLAGFSATRRYLADASYWFYIAHMPIVMALQVAVSQIALPWFVKFPLVLAGTFAILFATYALFVRNSFIGATLNGRRMPGLPKSQPAGLVADSA